MPCCANLGDENAKSFPNWARARTSWYRSLHHQLVSLRCIKTSKSIMLSSIALDRPRLRSRQRPLSSSPARPFLHFCARHCLCPSPYLCTLHPHLHVVYSMPGLLMSPTLYMRQHSPRMCRSPSQPLSTLMQTVSPRTRYYYFFLLMTGLGGR
jgi:hypothetical protein